jgi:tetratricopeptide (TPR) repeat protein
LGGIAIVVLAGFSLPSETDGDWDKLAQLYEQGDFAAAVEALEGHLESNPDDDVGWTLLGRAYLEMDVYDEAQAAYDRALAINPERYQAWTDLGLLNDRLGDWDRAQECYETALGLNPDDPDAHSGLAMVAIRIYQDDLALEHAEQAYELDRRNPEMAAILAVVYHYNGLYEERDAMTSEAEELGYGGLDVLYEIYEGDRTLRQ